MSAEHVLTMLNEHEVKFVDLRFTLSLIHI